MSGSGGEVTRADVSHPGILPLVVTPRDISPRWSFLHHFSTVHFSTVQASLHVHSLGEATVATGR